MFERIDPNDSESTERFRRMATPQIDPERQDVYEVEKEIRRIVDRALLNLREDASSFSRRAFFANSSGLSQNPPNK